MVDNKIILILLLILSTTLSFGQRRWFVSEQWAETQVSYYYADNIDNELWDVIDLDFVGASINAEVTSTPTIYGRNTEVTTVSGPSFRIDSSTLDTVYYLDSKNVNNYLKSTEAWSIGNQWTTVFQAEFDYSSGGRKFLCGDNVITIEGDGDFQLNNTTYYNQPKIVEDSLYTIVFTFDAVSNESKVMTSANPGVWYTASTTVNSQTGVIDLTHDCDDNQAVRWFLFDKWWFFVGVLDSDEAQYMLENFRKVEWYQEDNLEVLPLNNFVDLVSNPVVALWDFDDIVQTPNTRINDWYDRMDNIRGTGPFSNNLDPWYTEETFEGVTYPALAFNENLGSGTIDYGQTAENAYFLDNEYAMVTILKRNTNVNSRYFWTMKTGSSGDNHGFNERDNNNIRFRVSSNTEIDYIPIGLNNPSYLALNYTPTAADVYYSTDSKSYSKKSGTYADPGDRWGDFVLNFAARNSGGNDAAQVSYIDKIFVFQHPLSDSEVANIFRFWKFIKAPDHLINNFTTQRVVYEFLPKVDLVNDTVDVDEYYEPISGKTFIDAGSTSRFRLDTWNSAPNYWFEGALYNNNTIELENDTVITVVSRVSGSTLGGQVFSNFTLDEKNGLRHQSFRFYGVQPSNVLDELEVYTNEVDDRTHVSLMNPITGNKYLWEGQTSFDSHSGGPYTTTPAQRFSSFCLGCTNTNRDEWKGRVYGAYVLDGNPTLQEAKDLITYWDFYHDRRVNRSNTYSISQNIDNNLIAGWAIDTNYMAIDSMVSAGRYHIDSIECILGDRAGDSNFDLIETGTGSVFDINLVSGSKGYLNLDATSIKTRGSVSMGTNISYIIFWTQPFSTSSSTIISEFTGTGNTTGFVANTHTNDNIGVYNNNNLFSPIVTGYPEDTEYFGELGWNGNTSRWDIEQKTDGDFWKVDYWADDYSYTSYASGSNNHGTGLAGFSQPVFNGRDGGLFDVADVNYHKYILIFSGSLSQEEKDDLYRAILSGKTLVE